MLRGIYTAASSMSLSMQKMNLFAENLSNSQTTGYKKKTYAVHSFEDMLVELPDVTETNKYAQKLPVATGSYMDKAAIKQQQGRLRSTGQNLDLAILGEKAYFQLEIKAPQPEPGQPAPPLYPPENEKKYTTTRNGNFMIDVNNFLVNGQGDYVLDTNNQRIRLTSKPEDAIGPVDPNKRAASLELHRIRIDRFGNIFDEDNKVLGPDGQPKPRATIKMVQWTENADLKNQPIQQQGDAVGVEATEVQRLMKKYGISMPDDKKLLDTMNIREEYMRGIVQAQNDPRRGLYRPMTPGEIEPLGITVKQGFLESSNIDITTEMVNMMMTSKDYDMSQKLIAAEDKILDKTINEMGRLQ